MRDSTIEILKALKKRSGSDLLNLWEDLRQIDKSAFIAALETINPPKKARGSSRRSKKGELAASFASEEARIAYVLKESCGLTGKKAVEALRARLVAEGFPEGKLPPVSSSITDWIRAATRVIPSGTLMEVARSSR